MGGAVEEAEDKASIPLVWGFEMRRPPSSSRVEVSLKLKCRILSQRLADPYQNCYVCKLSQRPCKEIFVMISWASLRRILASLLLMCFAIACCRFLTALCIEDPTTQQLRKNETVHVKNVHKIPCFFCLSKRLYELHVNTVHMICFTEIFIYLYVASQRHI